MVETSLSTFLSLLQSKSFCHSQISQRLLFQYDVIMNLFFKKVRSKAITGRNEEKGWKPAESWSVQLFNVVRIVLNLKIPALCLINSFCQSNSESNNYSMQAHPSDRITMKIRRTCPAAYLRVCPAWALHRCSVCGRALAGSGCFLTRSPGSRWKIPQSRLRPRIC